MNSLYLIRKYKKEDKKSVRRIACDTAFMGEPCEKFFNGRDFLADILTLYFTDYEPESCFVAELNDKVIGYLTGCRSTKRFAKIFIFKIIPRLIIKFIFRGIILSKKNFLYFLNLFKSLVKGELRSPNLSKSYPALLHINIDAKYRKLNIGAKLIENYLHYLKSEDVTGCI